MQKKQRKKAKVYLWDVPTEVVLVTILANAAFANYHPTQRSLGNWCLSGGPFLLSNFIFFIMSKFPLDDYQYHNNLLQDEDTNGDDNNENDNDGNDDNDDDDDEDEGVDDDEEWRGESDWVISSVHPISVQLLHSSLDPPNCQ